jgi:hypothetical protein
MRRKIGVILVHNRSFIPFFCNNLALFFDDIILILPLLCAGHFKQRIVDRKMNKDNLSYGQENQA